MAAPTSTFPALPVLDDKQRFIVIDHETGAAMLYEVQGLRVVSVQSDLYSKRGGDDA